MPINPSLFSKLNTHTNPKPNQTLNPFTSMPEFNHPINSQRKKIKLSPQITQNSAADVLNDENLLYEILKHADERSLGAASCVSKRWNRTAQDERLWELICTRHWSNMACSDNQLRCVVLALGGFRRLHAHYLLPLSKSYYCTTGSSSNSTVAAAVTSSVWSCLPQPRMVGVGNTRVAKTRWGKDEVQLSLSLLSVRYFEKISFGNRNN